MSPSVRTALFASLAALTAGAAEPERPPPQPPPVATPTSKTGKERLSGKWTDEQRVDDCKVPPERRTRPRPAACPWEFGS